MNCLTEIFVEKSLARAKELDARLKATGKVVGPLHGLPISLKDQVSVKGLETTMGMRVQIYRVYAAHTSGQDMCPGLASTLIVTLCWWRFSTRPELSPSSVPTFRRP